MNLIIRLATFIPWIISFVNNSIHKIDVLSQKKFDNKKYLEYLNKNFFKSLNIRELILFILFVIFLQYKKTIVLEIFFPAIYFYLITIYKENKIPIKNMTLFIESILIVIFVIFYFIITKRLYTTYIIMFALSLLCSFVVYVLNKINVGFKKKTL